MALDPVAERIPAVLLSASIPAPDRPAKYFDTADIVAIRDCIKALVAAVVPHYALIWGGHPSITPMIRLLAESMGDINDYFVLYQSRTFTNIAPKDNEYFHNVVWVEGTNDVGTSLAAMRKQMLNQPNYKAAVFVGGMKGIEDEFKAFQDIHPRVPVYPIASTGGAASILFREWRGRLELPSELETEVAYPFLFGKLFGNRLLAR